MNIWLRRTMIGCGSIAALIALGILGLMALFWILTPNPFNDRAFDRQLWLASTNLEDPDNPRGQMFEDLQKRHLPKTMTKTEVMALLGTPDLGDEETRISYNLGMWSGMRMDFDSLEIEFDGDGRVRRVFRRQH